MSERRPGAPAAASTMANASPRVRALIDRMTLEEKISFVHGVPDPKASGAAGYIPGVPRLGIPELRLADGPVGIRVNQQATAMPAPIALGSSFDDRLAHEFGSVIGREGRALGQDVLLSPMTNIVRVPHAGRNFETFGEDPLLCLRMVSAEVQGIQSQGLIATVKHLAANNQEADRMTVNASVDEQTLREIELPAFQAAVDVGVGSVMCAYNKVNGTYASENRELLTEILREEWGFPGWVMSDWGATHSTTAISMGLDQEMPDGEHLGDALKTAVEEGAVPGSAVEGAVARILGQMERFGLLDARRVPVPDAAAATASDVALRVAEAGAVLLRNRGQVLPLDERSLRSVAVIGATARTPKVDGGGSSHVRCESATAPLDAIRERAGPAADVTYSVGMRIEGSPIPADALSPRLPAADGVTITVPQRENFSHTGSVTVPTTGWYRFGIDTANGYGTVQVGDGDPVVAGRTSAGAYAYLEAGTHTLRLTGRADSAADLRLSLTWVTPEMAQRDLEAAVAAARSAEVALVFAFDNNTEGADRPSLSLPGNQDALVSAIAAVNASTVVVLNTASSVTMPWVDDVAAVLDMWYPGQEGAEATSRLLFGDANPSGKLTQTFPAAESRTPVAGDPRRYPGVDGEQEYSEGIYVGYRWYQKEDVRPLFPFGHGLSYTSFEYTGLRITSSGREVTATFTLSNTGSRVGGEVVQLYVGPSPDLDVPQAVASLAGYEKVRLDPGESRDVQITIDDRRFRCWDNDSNGWVLGTGVREVWVGSSSDDLRLSTTFDIARR
ncbi:MAG: glycoside hydrolase family 3 C-terminal domain-containing protein [Candidatus Dormibacteraeota bacterium]|nr:glycoside hydrolase family 3 C-terminal domain-containing protein [Candidatus Dormibacteraeota bacterium]